jgi:hypothetical protein
VAGAGQVRLSLPVNPPVLEQLFGSTKRAWSLIGNRSGVAVRIVYLNPAGN